MFYNHSFYYHPSVLDRTGSITIAPVEDSKNALTIRVDWFQSVEQTNEENEVTQKLVRVSEKDRANNIEARRYLVVKAGSNPPVRRSLEKFSGGLLLGVENSEIEFIKAQGLSIYRIAQL